MTSSLVFAASVSAAELTWQGPADCDRSTFVVEQVESLVGRSLATVDGLKFEIRVQSGAVDRWELTLVTRDAADAVVGERTFQERSCVAVTDASAVAMAMAIKSAEGEASEAPGSPRRIEAAPPVSSAAPERDQPAPSPSAASDEAVPAFGVALGVVTDTGALPNLAFGAALGVSVRLRSLRLRADGAWFAPNTDRLATGRSAEFELATGALLGCFERPLTSVTALGCAGYELGRMSGEGRGVTAPRAESVLWQAIRLEAGATFTLVPDFRLLAMAGVALPVERHDFELEGVRVHRSAFGMRAQVGAELSL